MAVFGETTGVGNMVLLDNCDEEKLIENLQKRLKKNIIYVRLKLIRDYSFVIKVKQLEYFIR